MHIPLLILTLALYVLGTFAFVSHLLFPRPFFRRLGSSALGSAFLVETLAIVFRSVEGGYVAVISFNEALAVVAWLIVGAYLLMRVRYRDQVAVLGAFIAPLAFLFTFSAYMFYSGERPLPAVVRSAWLPIHIAPAVLGYAILAVSFCLSLAYLLQEKQLKSKRKGSLFRRLPSLETLDQLNYRFVTWGFSLFTIAIITGALLAKVAWGEFWSWEPVQIWSAVTWLLYAMLLQFRLAGWRGRKAARLTILGFAMLVVTFFSVSLVFPGKHGVHFG